MLIRWQNAQIEDFVIENKVRLFSKTFSTQSYWQNLGTCECMEGVTGTACERLDCEGGCFGFGKCTSMTKFAEDTR